MITATKEFWVSVYKLGDECALGYPSECRGSNLKFENGLKLVGRWHVKPRRPVKVSQLAQLERFAT